MMDEHDRLISEVVAARAAQYLRYATSHGVKVGWPRLASWVLLRDSFTCHYCGLQHPKMVVDHMVPLSLGGTDDLGNLVAACEPCNRSKSAKTYEAYKERTNAA